MTPEQNEIKAAFAQNPLSDAEQEEIMQALLVNGEEMKNKDEVLATLRKYEFTKGAKLRDLIRYKIIDITF